MWLFKYSTEGTLVYSSCDTVQLWFMKSCAQTLRWISIITINFEELRKDFLGSSKHSVCVMFCRCNACVKGKVLHQWQLLRKNWQILSSVEMNWLM